MQYRVQMTCRRQKYIAHRNLPDCIVAVRRLEVRWFIGSCRESNPPPRPRPVRTAQPACHGVLVDDWIHVEAAHSRCRVFSLRLRKLSPSFGSFFSPSFALFCAGFSRPRPLRRRRSTMRSQMPERKRKWGKSEQIAGKLTLVYVLIVTLADH